jgi:hypothetical protein
VGVFDADKDRADFPGKRWLVTAHEAGYVVICYMAICSRMMLYEVVEHYAYLREWTNSTASYPKSATKNIEVLCEGGAEIELFRSRRSR